MEFKRLDVILNGDEMLALGRGWSDMSPDMRFAFRRHDLEWLAAEFKAVVDEADITLAGLKKHRHLSSNTERVFTVQSNKVVAESALTEIATFNEKLKRRQHKNSIKRYHSLFLEPPTEFDNMPDPAS